MYEQRIEEAFEAGVGPEGASHKRFNALIEQCVNYPAQLKEKTQSGALPMLALAEREDDLAEMECIAADIRQRFDRLVVFGTGGSSLGGQALVSLGAAAGKSIPVLFVDNVDPAAMEALFATLDLKRTGFLIISKSGTTVETLAQLLATMDALRKRSIPNPGRQCMCITIPGENPLRRLAHEWDIPVIDHDPRLGGRFSVFSAVALLPAAVSGIDIRALRRGGVEVLHKTWKASAANPCEPMKGAALHVALLEKNKTIAVLMPYCDRLAKFGTWFCQIWAESIGKDGRGSTPVRALGAVDQHSQLQLYLDGPRDKFFTLLLLDNAGQGPRIVPELAKAEELNYLRGHTLGDIFNAQQKATAETLVSKRCPLRLFTLKALNERTMGGLLMHFMLETLMTAHLLNINAFDQPAVEESKRLAREYLALAENERKREAKPLNAMI